MFQHPHGSNHNAGGGIMAKKKSSKRSPKLIDLTGQRFGRLKAISFSRRLNKSSVWKCICDCGNTAEVYSHNLRRGTSTSCGCYQKENARSRVLKHGLSNTKESKSWNNARLRCHSPNNKDFKHYCGRGIIMCPKWRKSFLAFLKDMGPCPEGYTLDRINPNGNYEKSNCRWAPREDQPRNQRRSIMITHNGETHSLLEWAKLTGISYSWLYHRHRNKEPIFSPIKSHKPYRQRRQASS